MGFEKTQNFSQAYGFSENRQFGAKTDRNSVILDRDP
jgi:hypothetical protein